jgi:hypothetical protein
MAKVYDALRRAEEERKRRSGAPNTASTTPLELEPARPQAKSHAARPSLWKRLLASAGSSEPTGDFNKRRISLLQPDSYVAEQFRSLRGRIDAISAQPGRTIAVTSPFRAKARRPRRSTSRSSLP